jgi:hypothetical protein
MQTLPAILTRRLALDFAGKAYTLKETHKNTFMVCAGWVTMYYILNADHSDIIDIQVD